MAGRIARTLEFYPHLVGERDGAVVGFACAAPFRPRAAYRWSTEVTLYVATDARRSGVGGALYRALIAILAAQGHHMLFAGITLPNDASVAAHEAVGFARVGAFPASGYKLGRWWDVGIWAARLGEPPCEPAEPVAFADLAATVDSILAARR